MGTDVTDKFYEVLQKHIEQGVPIKHCNFSPAQKRRAIVCMDTYHKLEENEMMNAKRYLRERWGRSDTEIRQDMKVIDWLLAELEGETKALSRYRVLKQGERMISMGQSTGDWKPIEAGSKLIIKAAGLDRPDAAVDVESNTHILPPVIVDVAPNGIKYSEEEIDKLRKKYNVEKDKTQEMVEAKIGLFVPAGSILSDVPQPSFEPLPDGEESIGTEGESNIFDRDDPDDDGL